MEIANMWVGINVDDKNFKKAMQSIQTQLEGIKTHMGAMEEAAQKAGINLGQSMSGIDAKMQLAQAEFEKSTQKLGEFGSTSEKMQVTADALSKQMDLQKDKVGTLAATYNEFIKENDASSEAAIRLKTELTREETALAKLQSQLDSTNAEIKKSESRFEKLKDSMHAAEASSKKLAVGLAAIGASLVAVSAKLMKAGIDRLAFTESATKALETMMGSAEKAKAFMDELGEFARGTPFAFPDLAASARNMVAFGMESGKVIPTLTAIGDAVAGIGGGKAELESISDAFGKIQAAGRLSMEEINSLSRNGIPALQILANQAGVTAEAMRDQISKGAIDANTAIQGLVQGIEEGTEGLAGSTAKFGGMMESQQFTWTGALDKLSGAWARAGEEIMRDHMPVLIDALHKLTESISDLPEVLGPVVDALAEAFGFLVEKAAKVLKYLANFDEASLGVKVAIVGIAGAITAALIPSVIAAGANIVKAIRGVMLALGPWMAIGAAIAALAYLIYKVWSENMFGIQDKVKTTGAVIASAFQTAIAAVMLAFNKLKEVAYNVLQSIMNAVSPVVGVLGKVAPGLEKAFGKAQKAMKEKGDAASKEAEKQAAAMKKAAANLKTSAGEMKEAFSDWSTPAGSGGGASFADFRQKFETPTDAAGGADPVTQAADAMETAAGKGAKAAKDLKAAWETATESLKTKLAQVKAVFDITGNQLDMTGTKAAQLQNKIDALSAQMEIQKQIIEETNNGYEAMKAEKGENSEEAEKLKLKLLEEKKALSDLEKQLFDTKQALRDHAQEFKDLAKEIDKVEKKYKDDLASALEDYQKKVEDVNRKVREDEQRTTEAYEKALDDRTRALSNFVGLFDEVAHKDVSGETLLANLRGQVDAFENWSENISTLAARGVDQGLIEELKQMGPKAGPEIAALNTLTDEQLIEYVGLWRTKNQEARQEAISQLQQQRVEMQQKLQEIRAAASEQLEMYRAEWEKKNAEIKKNTDEELTKIQNKFEELAKRSTVFGQQFVMGFVGGMESRFDSLRKAAEEMASIVSQGVTGPLEIRSPSRLMARYGVNIIEGLMEGLKSKLPSFENLVGGMAMLTPAAVGPSITNSSSNTSNVFNIHVSGGGTREQAEDIMRELHRLGVRF